MIIPAATNKTDIEFQRNDKTNFKERYIIEVIYTVPPGEIYIFHRIKIF